MEERGRRRILENISKFLAYGCNLGSNVTFKDVARSFGIMKTNSIGLKGLEGRAVYPIVSLMSHSCANNLTVVMGPGKRIAFKPQKAIKHGEELTIWYGKNNLT